MSTNHPDVNLFTLLRPPSTVVKSSRGHRLRPVTMKRTVSLCVSEVGIKHQGGNSWVSFRGLLIPITDLQPAFSFLWMTCFFLASWGQQRLFTHKWHIITLWISQQFTHNLISVDCRLFFGSVYQFLREIFCSEICCSTVFSLILCLYCLVISRSWVFKAKKFKYDWM